MTTLEIANQLVALCRQGKFEDAKSLYADDAVSVEAGAPPGQQREAVGLAAIEAKGKWWSDNHEVHSFKVTGPWPHDDRFIVGFEFDVTMKATGQRFKMEEAGLYTVRDGAIVREEFFYSMGG
ncbi:MULTISPECIES: nuclear transport factor 2 family protein [Variovorax]|jgi:ketosteroid isomerase-like protein|uniref:Ketosteroid isomerase n=1 Tax=Variovorax paradoxus TaxID=34073 RepID=A0AA91DTF0_VARPD|nr:MULTISPECIES: nuclear transport factor 2 family protein [Variovorax]AVQ81564.1 nuclear transport factor 2 family protein [Variovorax sp. PMC12]OAK66983.1 ketosteroid isomerase [Variovorax paradoxus]QRY34114.1 nuclear transport factor 2 family protein [Variovorax sp. PDNC026]